MGQHGTRSQPEVWEAVWRNTGLTEERVRRKIAFEQTTLRWKAIRDAFKANFRTLKGLRTIELGAGTGDISLLLALEGAVVTLLDANEKALAIAAFQFGVFDIEPHFVTGDFFDLDRSLLGKFEAAVSYGVMEHFEGPDRVMACRSHVQVLRPGGMVAISVPNAHCLPYRVNKWWRETRGTWAWGLELPYTRSELNRVAKAIGLNSWFIHGSSFLRDWDQFLLTPITGRITWHTGLIFEQKTPFDNYFGHALTLIGGIQCAEDGMAVTQ
jgi:2-polyprenyl-3-methyl-5-hydroxy-6-metoxy-1,4-benzoquinol methylase